MSWKFKGNLVTMDDMPDATIGFVYKIVHIPTGKYYIGKKNIATHRRVKLGKRELAAIKEERKANGISGRLPAKKFVQKESDWQNYYSSNDWIKEQIKAGNNDDFSREIIQFCQSKKSLTYWEVYWQFKYDVLSDETSINDSIGGRYFRRDL